MPTHLSQHNPLPLLLPGYPSLHVAALHLPVVKNHVDTPIPLPIVVHQINIPEIRIPPLEHNIPSLDTQKIHHHATTLHE